MNKMRERIAEIVDYIIDEGIDIGQLSDLHPINITEIREKIKVRFTNQILALFDISKVEVEEDCVLCQGYGNHSIDGKLCNGVSLHPATFEDLKKGGILKVKK